MKLLYTFFLLTLPLTGSLHDNLHNRTIEFSKNHPEASIGFYAYDINSKAVIYEYNSEKNLAPASALKALTTASAIEILGGDFRFETGLIVGGSIKNGMLEGDLHIIPSGDPTIGSKYFNGGETPKELFSQWVLELKTMGIQAISGKVILEMNGFELERVPPKWSYEDLGNYFGASLAPLNCFDNQIYLSFKSGTAGSRTTLLKATPSVPELRYQNNVEAANIRYDNAYVFGAPRQYNQSLRGQIPANRTSFQIKASIPEPELFFAQQLVKELRNGGIQVPQGAISINQKEKEFKILEKLSPLRSPTLSKIIAITNLESNNLFAESLVKAISLKRAGVWSRVKGLELMIDFWHSKGVELSTAHLHDGSGLTRYNGVSARQLTEIMVYMWQSKNRTVFYKSLPIAGVSGSISGMFKGSNAVNNLRAKSGYLNRVRSYTGYTKTAFGKEAAFTLLVNNYHDATSSKTSVKLDMELLMRTLAD